jgi:hypothetical protein
MCHNAIQPFTKFQFMAHSESSLDKVYVNFKSRQFREDCELGKAGTWWAGEVWCWPNKTKSMV